MKATFIRAVVFLVAALFSGTAYSAGEAEFIVQKTFTSVTPIFMSGHEGDLNWVEGLAYSGQIFLNGQMIGTVSGDARLWNPPLRFTDTYGQVSLNIVNNIDGVGSFQVNAQGVALTSSTFATQGDTVLAWSGSIANGTGALTNAYGLTAGNAVGNLFAGTATVTEVIRLRIGF